MGCKIEIAHIDLAIKAAILAGQEIRKVYNSDHFGIEQKLDKSLLTKADILSQKVISEVLSCSKLPLLSEEGKEIDYLERKNWELFWLVDPINGTKEFVSRNGEFTVNIALIQNRKPVAGVIYAPVGKELYVGAYGLGAYKKFTDHSIITFQKLRKQGLRLPLTKDRENYVIVGSRSFMNKETKAFIDEHQKKYPDVQISSKGSSLKICMVAEGWQIYIRVLDRQWNGIQQRIMQSLRQLERTCTIPLQDRNYHIIKCNY